MGHKYFGLEVKEQVGRVGSCDVGNYLPICPLATSSVSKSKLATSSVKIKRRSSYIHPTPFNLCLEQLHTGFVLSPKVEVTQIFPRESATCSCICSALLRCAGYKDSAAAAGAHPSNALAREMDG